MSVKDKFEEQLKKNAIYTPFAPLQNTDIDNLLSGYRLEFLSIGTFSRVFKIEGTNWVIKEGRWDIDISIFPNIHIPIPGKETETLLKMFSINFLPSTNEINRQYKLYLDFINYLGYFDHFDSYYHPDIKKIWNTQRRLRESLFQNLDRLEDEYGLKISKEILGKVIKDGLTSVHNFLPKEYLLAGRSISKENEGRDTYYIFQEFIEGVPLHDVNEKDLEINSIYELILMFCLILLMHFQLKLLPDTRPRYTLIEAANWISSTDNIIISKNGVKFIDTRWFWETDSNIVKRGFILPNIIITQIKNYLKILSKGLDKVRRDKIT